MESYQSLLGIITHFCTCRFIFQLFFQLRERKRIVGILLSHSERYYLHNYP
nr:photosystem II protein L [Polyalthiopsis verrucipes]